MMPPTLREGGFKIRGLVHFYRNMLATILHTLVSLPNLSSPPLEIWIPPQQPDLCSSRQRSAVHTGCT